MKEKTTISVYVTEDLRKKILALIGYSEQSGKSISDTLREYFERITENLSATSDVPLGEPIDPETEKARQELLQKLREPPTYPIPPCNYASKEKFIDPKTKLESVLCDHPKRAKNPPTIVPIISCVKCWERKQWIKQNIQRKIVKKVATERAFCPYKQQYYHTKEDLPCNRGIIDLPCPNKYCSFNSQPQKEEEYDETTY